METSASRVLSARQPGWLTLEAGSPGTAPVVTIIHLGGDITMALSEDLNAAAETAIRRGGRVIVDVAEVASIGEVGLYFFAMLLRRRPSPVSPVSVINVHGSTRQLLERTGLITLLDDSVTPADPAS